MSGAPLNVVVLPSLIAPVADGACFGGAEMAALALTEALAERGHRVIMIGLAGSHATGAFVLPAPAGTPLLRPHEEPPPEHEGGPFTEIFHELTAMAKRGQLDVVHLHLHDAAALHAADAFARRFPKVCVVSTLHLAAVFPSTARAVKGLLAERTPIVFVTPSAFAARSYGPNAGVIRVIPNGVPVGAIRFHAAPAADRHLAWAGRRTPEKGVAAAVEIAILSGRSIVVAGEKDRGDGTDRPGVVDLGKIPRATVPEVLGDAECTLITSSIAEAHPLVAIESLAAGTPVIGFRTGGLAEIVDVGVNGFLVPTGDVEAAAEKLDLLPRISREACRRDAERRFDHGRMVREYEIMYRDWRPWPI